MERKRSDIIADELESLILNGSFGDGERLDEVMLAERFAVSRTPLREALQRLALSGLVRQIPRRGVFVRQPGPVELVEMFEVMAELEAACARFAAMRISEDALAELSETLFDAGVLPYYLHQLDRVQGAAHFEVSDIRARQLTEAIRQRLPGYLVPKLVREIPAERSKTPL